MFRADLRSRFQGAVVALTGVCHLLSKFRLTFTLEVTDGCALEVLANFMRIEYLSCGNFSTLVCCSSKSRTTIVVIFVRSSLDSIYRSSLGQQNVEIRHKWLQSAERSNEHSWVSVERWEIDGKLRLSIYEKSRSLNELINVVCVLRRVLATNFEQLPIQSNWWKLKLPERGNVRST